MKFTGLEIAIMEGGHQLTSKPTTPPRKPLVLEFIQTLMEGARIDHPEDLIFSEGSKGAARAIQALADISNNPETVTIKWDGFPAIVFGRNADGVLVVADKHMFTKKDGSGRVTSLEQFIQYDANRGANRGDLYEKMRVLWPALEQAVPPNDRGYYWGDLLWVGVPPTQGNRYVFKPNTVTYSVDVKSALGKRIAGSVGGIVVHQFFPDFDQEPQVLQGTGHLNLASPVCIFTPQMDIAPKIGQPVRLIKQAQADFKKYGAAIDKLLDPVSLAEIKCKDLPQLMQKFVNARVRGEQRTFAEWIPTVVTSAKAKNLLGEHEDGYLYQFAGGLNGAFQLFDDITAIKNSLIEQLDNQQGAVHSSINGRQGGEGYVFPTSQGLIKLVDRASFSAANFAKNP